VVLLAILAAAFNLRLAIVGPGPVIDQIRADMGMSAGVAGMLVTLPILCLGPFAFLGGALVRRFGAAWTVWGALVLIGAGTLVRAAMPSTPLLLAATLLPGIGIALAGVGIPVVVKHHFPARAGSVTGAYIASLSVGAAGIALLVVPLADGLGGWRVAFAASALPALLALALWRPGVIADERSVVTAALPRRLRPSRTALALALVFGLQSLCFAATIGWIAAVYLEAGWPRGQAALATATIPLLTIPTALLAPTLSHPGNRRWWVLGTGALFAAGLAGVAVAPTTVAWLWLLMLGTGSGAIFALVMTLPLDLRQSPPEVAVLTGWMLGLGYTISAAGPVLVGALRDLTGGFGLPVAIVAGCALLSGLVALSGALRPRAPEPRV
jgi:MFS transporter, CP family, cyanate transporter